MSVTSVLYWPGSYTLPLPSIHISPNIRPNPPRALATKIKSHNNYWVDPTQPTYYTPQYQKWFSPPPVIFKERAETVESDDVVI